MGLSLGDFLKSLGSSVVSLIPGGSELDRIIDLPSFGGNGGNRIIGGTGSLPGFQPQPYTGGTMSNGQTESYNNPYIPDFLEEIWNPGLANQNGQATQAGCPNIPVIVQPAQKVTLKAPKGYVIVECPKGSGNKVAMIKPVAIKMGYYKNRPKPPISAKQWRAMKTAETVKNKVKNIASTAGFKTTKR
jgi:hypothetical protein